MMVQAGRWVRRGSSILILDVGRNQEGAAVEYDRRLEAGFEAEQGGPAAATPARVTPAKAPQPQSVSFYSTGEDLKFLGTWTLRQPALPVHLIDPKIYRDIAAELVYPPDDVMTPWATGASGLGGGPMGAGRPPRIVSDPMDLQLRLQRYEATVRKLIRSGKILTILRLADQKRELAKLFAAARADNKEHVLFLVLDVLKGHLSMVPAPGVTASARHANIPIGTVRGTRIKTLPGALGAAHLQVIGDVHTHYLSSPSTTRHGSVTVTTRMGYGVSADDVTSARTERIVVYALDALYLHRANPDGTKNDKLARDINVLLDALEVFGAKPPEQRAYKVR